MHSQIYLSGKLAANPEVFATKKNKPWIKLLLETLLVRETSPGQFQSESVILPVSFFSREAEAVRALYIIFTMSRSVHPVASMTLGIMPRESSILSFLVIHFYAVACMSGVLLRDDGRAGLEGCINTP